MSPHSHMGAKTLDQEQLPPPYKRPLPLPGAGTGLNHPDDTHGGPCPTRSLGCGARPATEWWGVRGWRVGAHRPQPVPQAGQLCDLGQGSVLPPVQWWQAYPDHEVSITVQRSERRSGGQSRARGIMGIIVMILSTFHITTLTPSMPEGQARRPVATLGVGIRVNQTSLAQGRPLPTLLVCFL